MRGFICVTLLISSLYAFSMLNVSEHAYELVKVVDDRNAQQELAMLEAQLTVGVSR